MEIKKLENSSVQLTLTLGAAAIEEDYSKTIKDYVGTASTAFLRSSSSAW